jgi:exosortase C (VPDSG-CTERM-specific)
MGAVAEPSVEMKPSGETVATPVIGQHTGAWDSWRDLPRPDRRRIGGLVGYLALVTLLFLQPLAGLVSNALGNELHSYIPLVPFVAGYLLYLRRHTLTIHRPSIGGAVGLAAVGFAALAAWNGLQGSLTANDNLALLTLAYVSFVVAGGFLFLGSKWMAAAAFPVGFLVFMIPLPDSAVYWLEMASVARSADAAAWLFNATGTPMLRDGTILVLPGIVLEVAQECSGIRSSWVLFITSLVASNLFLTSPWRRILLVAFVIPLAIVRNAFRILVIGLLCVHIGPHMIDSMIHHRGGPIFFALSLIPLFLLLVWLRRGDLRRRPA